jgi:Bacterial protein of unknown function (DUF899)
MRLLLLFTLGCWLPLKITDRLTWQAKIDELRVKEKAHTRAGDALAANPVGYRWSKSIRRLR